MQFHHSILDFKLKLWVVLLAFWQLTSGFELVAQTGEVRRLPMVTNIEQLRHEVSGKVGTVCGFSLEGTILAGNSAMGLIFFQDASGTEILETTLEGRSLQPGQRVRLRGTNYVVSTETGISLGKRPLLDLNGCHAVTERISTLNLKAGRYPIEVLWFNYSSSGALAVTYSGPNFSRRTIPTAALFRSEKKSLDGAVGVANGLSYRCFEGQWPRLPFDMSTPCKTGSVDGFDIRVATRTEYVGLAFDGFIEIERDGLYTFYIASDDGSQLFFNNTPTELTILGSADVPAPRRIAIRQPSPSEQGSFWAEAEGVVTFVGREKSGADLELTSGDIHMNLFVCDGTQEPPRYFLGARVRARGVCLDTGSAEGQRLSDFLVVPDWECLQVLDAPPELWSGGKSLSIMDCKSLAGEGASDIVRLSGKVLLGSRKELAVLEDGTGSVPVELLNLPLPQSGSEIECLGRWVRSGSNSVLREAVWRKLSKSPAEKSGDLPVLTTAAQVQQLKREQAKLGYKAKLRGVVIWVAENRDCMVLQDATRGVFVGLNPAWIWGAPKVGEILEMEGTVMSGDFSPIVILNKGERLGMGRLPAPMHPTWDQLISGSMDSQYVEIRGFVTGIHDNHLLLLMPGGKVDVEFVPKPASSLESFINSVVRIRGCIFAKWDYSTLLVTPDHPLWFGSATICVDTPAPLDVFDAVKMRGSDLMRYDVQGNLFRRVKVSGQVLCGSGTMYYMNDGSTGLRFELPKSELFEPGDNVEAVGLVELGGASPVLREAVARKIGHSTLPAPVPLTFVRTNRTYDSTRVCVEGVLVGAKDTGKNRVLEMQIGVKNFVARLAAKDFNPIVSWPMGSRLQLTGVYSDLGGAQGIYDVNSFELLLNSTGDIKLVSRPPWWTLNRLLAMVTLLGAGLALAFFWISLLRRQVERRTRQLKREISERERAEQGRAIEQERTRIARDLHDDLGSSLTAVTMLAMTVRGTEATVQPLIERLRLIADKTRLMVTTLDELVWAVNPKNDTLSGLVEYMASFAEELLARTDTICRVELPLDVPERVIAAETRHNVLLAAKEALNNAIRHGRPTEVLLQATLSENKLKVLIQDNGLGFDSTQKLQGNGLPNLQERMRKVNGCCQIQSSPGHGTTVVLEIAI